GSLPSEISGGDGGGSPSPDFELDALVLLYEAILDCVIREIGVRLGVHLLEDARAIRAHRLVAQKKLRGDVAHRPARGQFAEHLEFSFAQLLMRRPVVAADIVGEDLRDCGTDVLASI